MGRIGRAGALGVALLLAGCGGAGPAGGELDAVPTFALAHEPEVRIGVAKGETPYLLHQVSDATRLSDGTILVANCGTSELRYFDEVGRHLVTVGGPGQGPGEFGFVRRVFPLGGDTVGVVDGGSVAVVAPQGEVVRTVATPGHGDVLGRMSNGSFVARRWDGSSVVEAGGHPRITASLFVLDGAGRAADSLVGLPASDADPPGQAGAFPSLAFRLRRSAVFAVHPDGPFYGGQDGTGVLELDTGLTPVDTVLTLTRPAPVTEAARDAFQAMVDEGGHHPPDDAFAEAPPPDRYAPLMPAFGDLVAGRDGRLWVQDPMRPARFPLAWTAYEGNRPVARVELPPRFFPFEFGRDWVLGVSFGELTVERVELWRMSPGELPGAILPPRDAEPPTLGSRCGAWTSR